MFYDCETIANQLKCPNCSETYVSPRILPCGKSICQKCIENLVTQSRNHNPRKLQRQNSYIESCPFCSKSHSAQDDETGYILNEFIVRHFELKPEKVYRCQSYEKFDNLLETLNADLKELNAKLNSPEQNIRDHCDALRNQIDIATETLIENINKFREQYINEINSYEEMCHKNFKEFDKNEDLFKLIKENEDTIKNFNNYVNRPKIEENEVKNLIQDGKVQEYKLKNQIKLIDAKLFGHQKPMFEQINKFVDPSIIGRLNYENLIVANDLIDIDKIVKPKIEKNIEHLNVDMALPLVSFNDIKDTIMTTEQNSYDDKYLILSGHYLKIINDYHTLVEINFDHQPDYVGVNRIEPAVFVQHYRNTWRNSRKEKANTHTLSIYDYNLNLNYEFALDSKIISCTHNNQNIFVQTAVKNSINIYNWCLEKLITIGQDSYSDRPFYFRNLQLKLVKNDRIYMKKVKADDDGVFRVKIISLTNGELLNEFYLNSYHDHFFVDALSRTIVIDDIFSNLKIYEKPNNTSNQAQLIMENNLDLANTHGLQVTMDGKLFFVKNKKIIQYYSFCS